MDAQDYAELLEQLRARPDSDFAAPAGKTVAMVYSGFDGMNQGFARSDCLADDALYLITDTVAGRALHLVDELGSFDREQRLQVWREASLRFAENAQGDVQTNVIDARGDWVFRNIELPAMLANENVAALNGVPVAQLRSLNDAGALDFDWAYEKVCDAELDRDQGRAATLGGDALRVRADWKAQALHVQQYREIEHQKNDWQTLEAYYGADDQEDEHEEQQHGMSH